MVTLKRLKRTLILTGFMIPKEMIRGVRYSTIAGKESIFTCRFVINLDTKEGFEMKTKIIMVLLGAFLLTSCASFQVKKTVDEVNSAIAKVKATHLQVLRLWRDNNEFILAYIGDDLEKRLSVEEKRNLNEFTRISELTNPTETELGKSMRLVHNIVWDAIKEPIRLFIPELFALLTGL